MLDRNGNVIPGKELDLQQTFSGLVSAADQVKEMWLASDYPSEVRSNFAQFRHAHIHAMKALGKIAAFIDHREHKRNDAEAEAAADELPKLLADLLRCALKMAEVTGIDFAKSYVDRARQLAERWGH